MNTVFNEYRKLWPPESLDILEPLLSKVEMARYPQDLASLQSSSNTGVVIVLKNGSFKDIVRLMELGYEHCVDETREDFAQELLASSLMILRPKTFNSNPIPFFCSGFKSLKATFAPENSLQIPLISSEQKPGALVQFDSFLDRSVRMESLRDICMQVADELITNAIYNAPMNFGGLRPFQSTPRSEVVTIPKGHRIHFFAAYTEKKLVLGCEDTFGSFEQTALWNYLRSLFRQQSVSLKFGSGGTGIGFRMMLENSANFYLLSTARKRTLIVCAFMLKGLKSNLTMAKHVHFSFR